MSQQSKLNAKGRSQVNLGCFFYRIKLKINIMNKLSKTRLKEYCRYMKNEVYKRNNFQDLAPLNDEESEIMQIVFKHHPDYEQFKEHGCGEIVVCKNWIQAKKSPNQFDANNNICFMVKLDREFKEDSQFIPKDWGTITDFSLDNCFDRVNFSEETLNYLDSKYNIKEKYLELKKKGLVK